MSGGDTVGEPASAVLFAFFVIVAGCAMTWVLARLPSNLPYTVWVFLFGIMMARIATSAMESGGVSSEDSLLRSVDQWMNIDPDLLLYTLLPPLLFDEAMKLDSHQVRMAIVPSALLALPGAAFGAYVQALVCYYWLGYDWEWLFCFMVGAVLSATDPVSVVSMLKEVSGGSTSTVKLTYLITGESLLNDGTALVIFEAIVSKHYNTDFSVVMYFVKVLLISPVLGVVLGLLTTYALRKAKRRLSPEDNTVQVALTMSCAYLSFFIAQWVLGVSGIICCCAAGIIIAWLAPALIIQPEQMETVWHTLEWVGNTMIFAIAGLIVGKYGGDIDGEVVSATFLIYVTMMLIRLSMLTICYPVVSTMSDGYSWKDVVFSTFGGLRGAISLALVLIIEKHLHEEDSYNESAESRYFDAAHGRKAMVIICGCVFLTIVINGTFAGTFFQWLYGSRLSSDVDEIIFHYVEKRIRRKARDFLSHTDILPPFDADEVKKLCHCFSYHFSTTTHTVEEKELLDGEMSGKGHVEFEDSDSGKHKVAVLVPGRDADKDEVAKHNIFGAKLDSPTPGSKQQRSPASKSDATPYSPGNINVVRRESSASSFTSLANQLLGRKEPDSNSINVERTYSESMYRSRPSLGPSYTLNNDLIVKFRQVFHGITKHCYMRQIANGRLTRGSSVALTLLHASRHGKETCDMPGLHDYDSIIEALEVYEKERERLERAKSYFTIGSKIWNFFNQWEDTYVGERVYILTSFIEAHNYAQRITIKYLGEKGFVDTEEEALILQESSGCIKKAQKLLAEIDADIISFHATEMVARMVLNMANDTVMQFQEEGILSEKDTEVFLDKSYEDLRHLHSAHHRHEQLKNMRESRLALGLSTADVDAELQSTSEECAASTPGGEPSPPPSPMKKTLSQRNMLWFFSASHKHRKVPQDDDSAPSAPSGGASDASPAAVDPATSRRLSLHSDDANREKLRSKITGGDSYDALADLEKEDDDDDAADHVVSIKQSAGNEGEVELQSLSSHSSRNSMRRGGEQMGVSITELVNDEYHSADVVRDGRINVTELLDGDHDLGDEEDALSRKFNHEALGRRDSVEGHAPPEDEADQVQAEKLKKSHRQ